MALSSFPSQINNVIQQKNYLERAFKDALMVNLAYRWAADVEPVPNRAGESVTKNRPGLRPNITTPTGFTLGSSTSGFLDNGLTPSQNIFESYSVAIGMYADTVDLDVEADKTLIASMFEENIKDLASQSARSIDGLVAQALHVAYEAGNSYATASAAASATSIRLNNVKGFDTSFAALSASQSSPGLPAAVSSSNPVSATWYPGGIVSNANAVPCVVTGVSFDGTNVSTSQSAGYAIGQSGTITLASALGSAVSVNDVFIAKDGAFIVRAGNASSTATLQASATLTLTALQNAKARLVARGVAPLASTGKYLMIIDPQLLATLWADSNFSHAAEGGYAKESFREGVLRLASGIDIVESNFVPAYAVANGTARHGIVVGKGAIVEAPFNGASEAAKQVANDGISKVTVVDNIIMVTRPPMDRLGKFITQSWKYTGGFVAPTDVTSGPATIPSSDSARYKRAVLVEGLA